MEIAVKGVNNKGSMIAWRFCLGLVEAGFFPGVMLVRLIDMFVQG